ncbi:MAG: polyprenyl synthetase family protein [Microbacter sp.]
MFTPEEIQRLVNQKIASIDFPSQPADLYLPVQYVLSLSGKRLRPVLTLMACNLFSDSVDHALEAAVGIEMFHNFTLLHDDIMDHADKRRGHPTVHRKWNENIAILSGDAMQIDAIRHLSHVPSNLLPKILNRFLQTAIEVCEGQQLDMDFETMNNVSEDAYLEMIRLKTAVLLAASLQIGAWLGGADDRDAELLYQFGLHLGQAFQLQDDLLDVYGDVTVFGKNIGGDIAANKKTFLLITALNRANKQQKELLLHWMTTDSTQVSEKVKAVTALYDALNMKTICENKIASLHEKAFQTLRSLSVPSERQQMLIHYATLLMKRQL